jgi:hypothetical protein
MREQQSPVLHPHLDPKRHVHASHGLQDGKVLSRVLSHVPEGPNPGLPDQRKKLPHAELAVVVLRDLHGGLKLRPSVEELEHLFLDIPVLPSHANYQGLGVQIELRGPGGTRQRLELRVGAVERAWRWGEVQGEPLDSPGSGMRFVIVRPTGN